MDELVQQAGASGGLGGVGAREMVGELNERINILMAENTVMADQVSPRKSPPAPLRDLGGNVAGGTSTAVCSTKIPRKHVCFVMGFGLLLKTTGVVRLSGYVCTKGEKVQFVLHKM